MTTKQLIVDELDTLPPETLSEVQAFIEFLRFKSDKRDSQSKQMAWQSALQETFGIWVERDDVVHDGVTYVQQIRQGHRLNDLMEPTGHEAD